MPKLYIAGDSFASLSQNQDEGTSWSELLANKFNYNLYNIARPGHSNESICVQIDYIICNLSEDDFVVIFLTDSFRKTLTYPTSFFDDKHLVHYHSAHIGQRAIENFYESDPKLLTYTQTSARRNSWAKEYFTNYYNYQFQKFLDITLITGSLAKLSTKTSKFLVVLNGFDDALFCDIPYNVDADLFCIPTENFLPLNSKKLSLWSKEEESINHLDLVTHYKVFNIISKKILLL